MTDATGTPTRDSDSGATPSTVHLRAGGTSVVVGLSATSLPEILHWGADLGHLDGDALAGLAANAVPLLENSVDVPVRVGVLPEHSRGWVGAPALQGHRNGRYWSTSFTEVENSLDGNVVESTGIDRLAGLELALRLELHTAGLLRLRATVRNLGNDDYALEQLAVALPVPSVASELLDQAGRWAKERVPQRRAITVGMHLRDSRRGRTGADAATVLLAGEAGFGFQQGDVWGLHVGFSGNHRTYLERMTSGRTVLGGGELLLPGEVVLAPGESYSTPWIYGTYGQGLDEAARRFHSYLRSRPSHPTSSRPVTLNTWEAVYFDHRLPKLLELAERAAELGVERYVLDDGWFRGRRGDTAGLGDWYVDETVWPDGLHPLVSRVQDLGMEFGLWFEPEMINPDSDLARAHPEWILQPEGRMPLPARHQQVLNLGIPAAYDYLLERISALVAEYGIAYLKWDHNRDLLEAGSTLTGRAGVHAQTLAVYRLLAELKERHPGLEIESCSSGGARMDLGMLEHTDRIWTSDCIDPLERQGILRWSAQLVPPELLGSHVGSASSHTTGRTHSMSFRGATALFGHFGIECDVTELGEADRRQLGEWVALHKRFRNLLHSGTTVRVQHPVAELAVHGVVAEDRSEALFELAMLARPSCWPVGQVRIPGLDPQRTYRVTAVGPSPELSHNNNAPAWQDDGGIVLSGSALAAVGLSVPPLQPEQSALVHLAPV